MLYRLECPANRYVFKSRLNCSESTAGSLRQSGSEFRTVGRVQIKYGSRRCRVELVHVCSRTYAVFCDPELMGGWYLRWSLMTNQRVFVCSDSLAFGVFAFVRPHHSGKPIGSPSKGSGLQPHRGSTARK